MFFRTIFRLGRLGGWRSHRRILALAFPMILANITTPLVGLVDTAVLGRLDSPALLAGASVSALIITQIVWICGFLRMSTTGRSAQGFGSKNIQQSAQSLWQGLALAFALGVLLLLLQPLIIETGLALSNLQHQPKQAALDYFNVRAWSFPLALANLVLAGWLIGQQLPQRVLAVQIIGNCLNVVLNITFVFGVHLGVKGVAGATVIAELVICILYLYSCLSIAGIKSVQRTWFSKRAVIEVLSVNSKLFLRNVILQMCLAFITLQGARYGVLAASINAVIMQFFALIALGLDGIAFAIEAQVGKAKGSKNRLRFMQYWVQGVIWSSFVAVLYALIFVIFGSRIHYLLTTHLDVLNALHEYKWLIIILPLAGHWCFLLDGIAVGLSRAKAMRDTMFISVVCGFFPTWVLFKEYENIALWLAMLVFLVLRGASLGGLFYNDYIIRRNDL